MPATSTPLVATDPLTQLAAALEVPPVEPAALEPWRRDVRGHLGAVRSLLATDPPAAPLTGPSAGHPAEQDAAQDGGLVARGAATLRRRDTLLTRIDELVPDVLAGAEVQDVCHRLERLVVDVQHHRQRVSDLAWDEVELELGGED